MDTIEEKSFSLAAQIDIIHRHRLAAIYALVVGIAISAFAALSLPKLYSSSTMLVVQNSAVPTSLINPHAGDTGDKITDRLGKLSASALSPQRLAGLIKHENLYSADRAAGVSMGRLVRRMAGNISVEVPKMVLRGAPLMWQRRLPPQSFVLTFDYPDPHVAQKVTAALANALVSEDMKRQTANAAATVRLIHGEMGLIETRLATLDQRIREVKKQYQGSLPEDLDANTRMLSALQSQLQSIEVKLGEQPDSKTTASGGHNAQTPAEKLESLNAQLVALRAQYSNDYPDVRSVRAEIASLERSMDQSGQHVTLAGAGSQTGGLRKLEQSLRSQIAQLQAKTANIPVHQVELIALNDDRTALTQEYHQLLDRNLTATMYEKIANAGQGDQLSVMEPASLSSTPSFPNRPLIFAVGAGLSIILALLLPFGLYFANSSIKEPAEIREAYGLPVIGTIPEFPEISYAGGRFRASLIGGLFATAALATGLSAVWIYAHILV